VYEYFRGQGRELSNANLARVLGSVESVVSRALPFRQPQPLALALPEALETLRAEINTKLPRWENEGEKKIEHVIRVFGHFRRQGRELSELSMVDLERVLGYSSTTISRALNLFSLQPSEEREALKTEINTMLPRRKNEGEKKIEHVVRVCEDYRKRGRNLSELSMVDLGRVLGYSSATILRALPFLQPPSEELEAFKTEISTMLPRQKNEGESKIDHVTRVYEHYLKQGRKLSMIELQIVLGYSSTTISHALQPKPQLDILTTAERQPGEDAPPPASPLVSCEIEALPRTRPAAPSAVADSTSPAAPAVRPSMTELAYSSAGGALLGTVTREGHADKANKLGDALNSAPLAPPAAKQRRTLAPPQTVPLPSEPPTTSAVTSLARDQFDQRLYETLLEELRWCRIPGVSAGYSGELGTDIAMNRCRNLALHLHDACLERGFTDIADVGWDSKTRMVWARSGNHLKKVAERSQDYETYRHLSLPDDLPLLPSRGRQAAEIVRRGSAWDKNTASLVHASIVQLPGWPPGRALSIDTPNGSQLYAPPGGDAAMPIRLDLHDQRYRPIVGAGANIFYNGNGFFEAVILAMGKDFATFANALPASGAVSDRLRLGLTRWLEGQPNEYFQKINPA
jgi:hypothetical protein